MIEEISRFYLTLKIRVKYNGYFIKIIIYIRDISLKIFLSVHSKHQQK